MKYIFIKCLNQSFYNLYLVVEVVFIFSTQMSSESDNDDGTLLSEGDFFGNIYIEIQI